MNQQEVVVKEVEKILKTFAVWVADSVMEAVFLIFWVLLQAAVGLFINWLQPTGMDQFVLTTIRAVFAISTLIPVATRVIQKFIQAKKTIEQETSH